MLNKKVIFDNQELEVIEMIGSDLLLETGDIITKEQIEDKIVSPEEYYGKEAWRCMQEEQALFNKIYYYENRI